LDNTTGVIVSIMRLTPERFNADSFNQILELLCYEVSIGCMLYMGMVSYELLAIFAASDSPDQFTGLILGVLVTWFANSTPLGLTEAFAHYVLETRLVLGISN